MLRQEADVFPQVCRHPIVQSIWNKVFSHCPPFYGTDDSRADWQGLLGCVEIDAFLLLCHADIDEEDRPFRNHFSSKFWSISEVGHYACET